jgi:hypothetical protein
MFTNSTVLAHLKTPASKQEHIKTPAIADAVHFFHSTFLNSTKTVQMAAVNKKPPVSREEMYRKNDELRPLLINV